MVENDFALNKIQNGPSLTDRAYEAIRAAILSLEIKPGKSLSIQELSEQLGVSRTPVRDALLRLQQEGFVSVIPYKGAYVASISKVDIEEVMELRIVLESYAARKAAKALSPKELARAEAILGEAELALSEGRHEDSVTIGQEFHRLLLSKVENNRMFEFMRQLDIHFGWVRLLGAEQPGRLSESFKEHRRTLAALKNRDVEAAGRLMEAHLSSTRDILLASFVREDGDQGFGSETEESNVAESPETYPMLAVD